MNAPKVASISKTEHGASSAIAEIASDRLAAARAATHTPGGRIKGLWRLRVPEDRTAKGLWTLQTIRRGQPIDAGQMFGISGARAWQV